jgi:16S rRNA processing protein RimM
VHIGRILAVHGLRGEVVAALDSGDAGRLLDLGEVEVERGAERAIYVVDASRPFRGGGLVKFRGVDTPEGARALKGADLFADAASLPKPEPGSYYHFQLVGLAVRTEAGEPLGEVAGVIEASGSDLLSVRRAEREHLIPIVTEFVRSVDLDAGVIVVRLPEGLLDL